MPRLLTHVQHPGQPLRRLTPMLSERQAVTLKSIEEDLLDARQHWQTMGGSLSGMGSTMYQLITRALAKIKEVNP